jgi:hypothetical protein
MEVFPKASPFDARNLTDPGGPEPVGKFALSAEGRSQEAGMREGREGAGQRRPLLLFYRSDILMLIYNPNSPSRILALAFSPKL